MGGLGDHNTKWSKSDKEKKISYDITYMQNLQNLFKLNYFWNQNRLTHLKNELMVYKGGSMFGGGNRLGV